MDEFVDPFLSLTSWVDTNLHESSRWDDTAASQLNGSLPDNLCSYGRNDAKPDPCVMFPEQMINGLHASQSDVDAQIGSYFLNPNLKYGLPCEESHLQHDIQDPIPIQGEGENGRLVENRMLFAGVMENSFVPGAFNMAHGSMAGNGSDASLYLRSVVESQSSAPQLWQAYPDASALIEQSGLRGFSLCRDLQSNSSILRQDSADHELLQMGGFARTLYENETLQNLHGSSFGSGSRLNVAKNIGIQINQQPSSGDPRNNPPSNVSGDPVNSGVANIGTSNGAAKPRARARRGQATDPHSIAERLRREKIAERMKNLQELVPNSNKTDKASMLDEIIDYVKFLQLQVRVLSMSRLGATGALVPLVADSQSLGVRNPILTSELDLDLCDTQENLAFEQEVVKLMESDVTAAMQFLQTKALCLMPITLASAIAARKGSSTGYPPKKSEGGSTSSVVNPSRALAKDKPEEQGAPNGCKKAAAKEEESKLSPRSARNLKSKA